MAAATISNLYYPAGSRHSAPLTVTNGLMQAGLDGVANLVQEFVLSHVTTGRKHDGK